MDEIEVTLRSPLEMVYLLQSRQLILRGFDAAGTRVTVRLAPEATFFVACNLSHLVEVFGPLGEECPTRLVQ